MALVLIGATVCSGPAVLMVLGDQGTLDSVGVAVSLSTGFWTWVLLMALRRRSPWNALWMGPIFGVLNASTACAFGMNTPGTGAEGFFTRLLLGGALGSMPGTVLGLTFGVAIAVFLSHVRKLTRIESSDATLRLLSSSAAWLAAIATIQLALTTLVERRLASCTYCDELTWLFPPGLTAALAFGVATWAAVRHVWLSLWLQRVEARPRNFRLMDPSAFLKLELSPIESSSARVLARVDHPKAGPFRNAPSYEPLTLVAPSSVYWVRGLLLVGLLAIQVWVWMV